MLRRSGGTVFCGDETTRSPTRISPAVGSTKPAMSRSVVVFPQPDGTSRQTSVPCSIVIEMLSTTAWGPYFFVNPRSSTDATGNLSINHQSTGTPVPVKNAFASGASEHRLALLHKGLAAFLIVAAHEAGGDRVVSMLHVAIALVLHHLADD